MRATVAVDAEGQPMPLGDGGAVADLDIASEHSLRVAVWALQHIKSTSACPGSRSTAEIALRAIGASGDLPVTPAGLPAPVKVTREELSPEFLGDRWRITTAT